MMYSHVAPTLGNGLSLAVVNRFSPAVPFPLSVACPAAPLAANGFYAFPSSLHRFPHLKTTNFLTFKIIRH
jgi:hypothetical protein